MYYKPRIRHAKVRRKYNRRKYVTVKNIPISIYLYKSNV